VELLAVLGGAIVVFAVALSVVAFVCMIVVLIKMFQNDQVVLAIVGLFVPLVLFVVGWIKAQEWGLKKTMVVWTISMILGPVLGVGVGLAMFGGALMVWGESRGSMGEPSVGWSNSPQPMSPVTKGPVSSDQSDKLSDHRGRVHESFETEVVGSTQGSAWGTDTYTDDSSLAVAAVHAGILKPGERGKVKVTMLPGQDSYPGSTRNGVTTGSWPNWTGSYRVEAAR
jgi:hypothetical protein